MPAALSRSPDRRGPDHAADRWCRPFLAALHPLLVAVLLLLATIQAAAATPLVNGIRFGIHPDTTRIVLDVSQPVAFSVYPLDDPYRLIVDLPEVTWRVAPGGSTAPRGLVTGYRFGLFERGISRLVVDLSGPFEVRRTLTLPPEGRLSHRLVIDLQPVAAGAFARAPVQEATPQRAPPTPRPAPRTPAADLPVPTPPAQASLPPAPPPAAAVPTPRVRPPAPPPMVSTLPMVVLDPGHGGVDPGTIGVSGVFEKDITLAMARELRDTLLATGRYRVHLTRDADVFMRLRERIQVAREVRADLFVSIHADSLGTPQFRGASVYTLSDEASDAEAASLARKENKADILAGTDLSNHDEIVTSILIDLAQRDANNKAIELAGEMVDELAGVTHMVRKTRRFAGFAVLRSPDVPSVLLELGYLSNARDEEELSSPEHRARLAQAIVRAVDRYFAARAS
jgi:N-acetylmuramoyl-L-alanine amidase